MERCGEGRGSGQILYENKVGGTAYLGVFDAGGAHGEDLPAAEPGAEVKCRQNPAAPFQGTLASYRSLSAGRYICLFAFALLLFLVLKWLVTREIRKIKAKYPESA